MICYTNIVLDFKAYPEQDIRKEDDHRTEQNAYNRSRVLTQQSAKAIFP